MKDILDYEEEAKITPSRSYWPYLLEGIPILFMGIFLLADLKSAFFNCIATLSLIYFFGGWYIFKTERHKWYNVLISTIAGLFIAIILLGPMFYTMNWEGYQELLIVGTISVIFFLILSFLLAVIRTLISENKKSEIGMSWKIFSRFLILFLVYFLTDMAGPYLDLIKNAE